MPIDSPNLISHSEEISVDIVNIPPKGQHNTVLSKQKLNRLEKLSEAIEKPSTLGQFNNENHYLRTLALVLESTNETQNRIKFFLKKIIPLVTHKKNLLDIGIGDGSLTIELAKKFNSITAVDTNKIILDSLSDRVIEKTDLVKINKSISDISLQPASYDLVLLSHVLYYLPSSQWINIIRKCYKSLTDSGVMVVVLGGDEEAKGELIYHFGKKKLPTNQLAQQCAKIFGYNNVDFFASNESFVSSSFLAMLHIAAFMLADAGLTATYAQLESYINKHFFRQKKHYEMTTIQKYIVIKKNKFNTA